MKVLRRKPYFSRCHDAKPNPSAEQLISTSHGEKKAKENQTKQPKANQHQATENQ
jgi:hypothetical protein